MGLLKTSPPGPQQEEVQVPDHKRLDLCQATTTAPAEPPMTVRKSTMANSVKILNRSTYEYRTIFGRIQCVTMVRKADGNPALGPAKSSTDAATQVETTYLFSVNFIRRIMYWRCVSLYGQALRSFKVYAFDEVSPLWKLCEVGDLLGVQHLLSHGASPYIVRNYDKDFWRQRDQNLLQVHTSFRLSTRKLISDLFHR